MKMIVQNLNGSSNYKIENRSQRPKGFITDKFEGQETSDLDVLDIVDRQDTRFINKVKLDTEGNPVLEDYDIPLLDESGEPVLDAEKKPIVSVGQRVVYEVDAEGNIIQEEINDGGPYKVAVFSQEKYDAKLAQQKSQEDAQALVQYKEDRRVEYPSTGDQLDALYKKLHLGDSTEYDALAASITATKLKYPKP